jgi:multicomponent Na+:H+ antiporter subunit E
MRRHFLTRLLVFSLLWAVLTGLLWRDLVIAGSGVFAAALLSHFLRPQRALEMRWRHLPALAAYFMRASVQGGIDIAYRALAPSMPIDPDLLEFESRLRNDTSLVLFAWMISLMPGTAAVCLGSGGKLTVHLVHREKYGEESLRVLEGKIACLIQQPEVSPGAPDGEREVEGGS